jgi:hypothetical protein
VAMPKINSSQLSMARSLRAKYSLIASSYSLRRSTGPVVDLAGDTDQPSLLVCVDDLRGDASLGSTGRCVLVEFRLG